MQFEPQAIFFDLDGTLVDSVPDLTQAVNQVMLELGLSVCSEQQVRNWVGNGAGVLLHRALTRRLDGTAERDQHERACQLFMQAYRATAHSQSVVYAGVHEGMERLRRNGFALACVTNKPTAFVRPLLVAMKLADYFQVIIGGDDAAKKPAPDALLLAARQLNAAIESCLLVGDSRNDVLAARNAGCRVFCVPYGYNHGEDIQAAQPDAVIASIAELPVMLAKVA